MCECTPHTMKMAHRRDARATFPQEPSVLIRVHPWLFSEEVSGGGDEEIAGLVEIAGGAVKRRRRQAPEIAPVARDDVPSGAVAPRAPGGMREPSSTSAKARSTLWGRGRMIVLGASP